MNGQKQSDEALRGVIFDMDGVLCDSERFICEAAIRMLRQRHGVDAKPEDFIPFVGTGENRYLGGVAEKYGVKLDLEADKKLTYDLYLEIIRGRLPPLPGVKEFIAECRRHGLKLAVATSADHVKMAGNLKEIGVPAEAFDATVNGLEVTHKKPHPEIFLAAARRLGLDPKACLVVEDAVTGIRAGKAAGARCLGLTTSFPAADLIAAGADWTCPNLAHVPGAVTARLWNVGSGK
jgi:beta-phosphoglucomutase